MKDNFESIRSSLRNALNAANFQDLERLAKELEKVQDDYTQLEERESCETLQGHSHPSR